MKFAFARGLLSEISPKFLNFLGLGSFILALSGPFGTFAQMPLLTRLLFWGLLCASALAGFRVLHHGLLRLLPGLNAVSRLLLGAMIFASVLTALVCGLAHWWQSWVKLAPDTAGAVWLSGWAIYTATHLAIDLMADRPAGPAETPPNVLSRAADPPPIDLAAGDVAAPRLLDRVPDDVRGPLVRVSVRDHYVDVWTEQGSAQLLMRFVDALNELEGADGLQVHRSHWVARRAIAQVQRRGGNLVVVLKDGPEVPVSRRFHAALGATFDGQAPGE